MFETVVIYEAKVGDRVIQWNNDKSVLLEDAPKHWIFDSEFEDSKNIDDLVIHEKTEQIEVIHGKLVDWSDEESLLHVHWTCLDCNREFYTDVEADTKSPQVWSCEYACKDRYFSIKF